MHKTSASPLALVYAALIVYASLYPFLDWRDQGLMPWSFLAGPWPRYWTGFDVGVNVIGYMPLGGLVALGVLRARRAHAVLFAGAVGAALSLAMESLQSYLPARVASREDFLLNALGAASGAIAMLLLNRWGVVRRWSLVRSRWFVEHARGGIVLLATWPLALMFPAPVPFGLGQILVRLEQALANLLQDTPFLNWLPAQSTDLKPLVPAAEMVCVALGLLIPCLLGFCVIRSRRRRLALVAAIIWTGVTATALSAALSWGPNHAWAWLGLPSQAGIVLAMATASVLVIAPWRASAALLLVALGIYLSLLNQAPESPYFSQTLQAWEQGRFIRFHGLAQWLGWLWPYAALGYVLSQLGRSDSIH
ncbi:MAG: VanZ family protein [Rhodoferax sp.]|nr:VanZ family protein [Rhodoferax sp.]MCF8210459.1 VanZ family protein [Rhodoferax sp.]